jgi:hypothetical protein
VLARGTSHAVLPAVIVASVASVLSAKVALDVRVAASERFLPSAVAAVEDRVAMTLAAASARASERP